MRVNNFCVVHVVLLVTYNILIKTKNRKYRKLNLRKNKDKQSTDIINKEKELYNNFVKEWYKNKSIRNIKEIVKQKKVLRNKNKYKSNMLLKKAHGRVENIKNKGFYR